MFIRRIVACACALALAVPAAAGARAGFDPPPTTQHVVYGDTKYDLQNTQDLAPKGDTKNDLKPSYVDRVGALSSAQLAAAYGTTQPKGSPVATSSDDGVNGWQVAAVAEAGLLAAIALAGGALVVRMRPRGTAHA